MGAQSFEDLQVWQKAHAYVLLVYQMTRKYPKEEIFGLTSQLRRAAISITANIAEGFVRSGRNEKIRFYNISQGSLEETKNYIILSLDLGYISLSEKEELYSLATEVGKLINAYRSALMNCNNS